MLTITVLQLQAASPLFNSAAQVGMVEPPSRLDLFMDLYSGNYLPVTEVCVETDDINHALRCAFVATNAAGSQALVRELAPRRSSMPGDIMIVKETGETHIVLALGTARIADHVAQLVANKCSGDFSSPADIYVSFGCPSWRLPTISAVRAAFGLRLAEAKELVESNPALVTDRSTLAIFVLRLLSWLGTRVVDEREGRIDARRGCSTLSLIITDFEIKPVKMLVQRDVTSRPAAHAA